MFLPSILATIAVLIQPCEQRDMVLLQYGGTPYGQCTIFFEDGRVPAMLFRSYETFIVTPKQTHSWFEIDEDDEMQMQDVHDLGYTGLDLNVEVMDGGVVNPLHSELAGHVQNLDSSGEHYHAMAVTQILVGQGVNASYRGVVPDAMSYNRDYNGNDISEKLNDFYEYGIIADNNSWGYMTGGWQWRGDKDNPEYWCDDDFGLYNFASRELDGLISPLTKPGVPYNPDTVIVFSAGNDSNNDYSWWDEGHYHCYCEGSQYSCDYSTLHYDEHDPNPTYGTTSGVACAKNILAAGAMLYIGNLSKRYEVASFSSSGPCMSGRIKPDFATPGVNIPTIKGTLDGTSMASPYLTGAAALVSGKWKNLTGTQADVSIVRGFLAQTARDIGNPGPDFRAGFGMPLPRDALELMDRENQYVHGIIQEEETITRTVYKEDNDPLRCTLTWKDYPSSSLNTDLDLTIKNGSTVYYPFVLDPENPSVWAETGEDHVNVIEMAEACNVPPCYETSPGTYTVNVYANWPVFTQGGHEYLLVCSHPLEGTAPCERAGEPNDTIQDARFLSRSGTYTPSLCPDGDLDYFEFFQSRDGSFSLDVSGTNLDSSLYNSSGVSIASGTSISRTLTTGTYYILVSSRDGTSTAYILDIEKQDPAHGPPGSRP